MKYFVALLALLLLASAASARPPEREGYWGDYARAPAPERIFGMSFTEEDINVLEDGNDNPFLIRWGDLFQVKCRLGDASQSDVALICLTMSRTSTPSWGPGGAETRGSEGVGTYDDTEGPSGLDGVLPCFTVDTGTTEWRKASMGAFYRSGSAVAPTFRTGRCTSGSFVDSGSGGAPCDTDAECGTDGVCTKDGQLPSGAWVVGVASNTAMTCSFEFGI